MPETLYIADYATSFPNTNSAPFSTCKDLGLPMKPSSQRVGSAGNSKPAYEYGTTTDDDFVTKNNNKNKGPSSSLDNFSKLASSFSSSPSKFLRNRALVSCGDDVVVFGCFSDIVKIDPTMFQTWMNIIKAVPNSVLVLLNKDDDKIIRDNILGEAKQNGVSKERIHFVSKKEKTDYLRDLVVVDLLLDTSTRYGAHTTALDALWQGVPILTMLGDTPTTRGAASMLKSLGLYDQLVTKDLTEYEEKAIHYGKNLDQLEKVRKELGMARFTKGLFNATKWTRDFEKGLDAAWKLFYSMQQPKHIFVKNEK